MNITPLSHIRGDGTFVRHERFTVRFTDGGRYVYRVVFRGRFLADGAIGTLRARMRIHERCHRCFPCDSGTQSWSAEP